MTNYKAFMIEIEKKKRKYVSPVAESFAVEEDGRLLENSFKQEEGSEEDWGEARPIVGDVTFDDENTHTSKAASFWEE
jgi:hypothetical protein